MKTLSLILLLIISNQVFSQKFYIGDNINPKTNQFSLLGISSETNVATYKYVGTITDKYFYGRRIGEIIVGVKNNTIVTTIYNLIPEKTDIGVPSDILDLIENNLPYPFTYKNGIYALRIDNLNITLSRSNNSLTFHKDRIMYFTSIKSSVLKN